MLMSSQTTDFLGAVTGTMTAKSGVLMMLRLFIL